MSKITRREISLASGMAAAVALSAGALIAAFAAETRTTPHCIVLGVPGPVRQLPVRAVNLPWLIDPTEIAAAHAGALAVETREVDIAPLASAFGDATPFFESREQQGNLRARLRMVLLYGAAADRGALVLGTSNKSELLTGYYTKWGDGGADLLPLGDLYKSQVQLLATALGVPAAIRERPPTAELWEGQTDEGELGLPYAQLDQLLAALERHDSPAKMVARGVPEADAARVAALVQRSIHKRIFPPVCKLGRRTVGIDWRETTGVRR